KLEKERIEKLTAEKTQKEKEAADKLRKEQEDAAVAKLEKERKEKLTAEKTQKEKEAADKLRKQQEDAALVKLEKERKEKLATDKKKEADAILAKQQEEHPYQTQQDKAKIDKETAALNRADSMLLADKQRKEKNGKVTAAKQSVETQKMDPSVTVIPSDSVMTDKQRKEQRDRDLVKMKRAREEAEARMLVEKRDKEAKEKMAKKESKRLAKELAEQSKLRKKSEEQARKLTEDQQRITAKKVQAETEQRELEAKRAHEEQEKKNLISQREKLLSNQQVRVARDDNQEPYNNSEKAVQEGNQKKAIADYQRKIKDDAVSSPDVVNLNTARPASVKVIKTRGYVKNGQTEDPLSNVSINIRRLNGIVSQEVASDNNGNYQFSVDSGYFYLVSFYKDKYEISKQILDLTSYKKPEYTMLIQYLKEHDEFDPASKMPSIQFEKNSPKVPEGLWSDLEPIVKMMQEVPQLKMKIYGLGSADEDYPMELSITRARLVADMMMEVGIKPGRIRINGVGSFRPRSGCVEGKQCTQEQYKMDRVVMYKVIKD
ncbi:MAG: flagellar motor protein MotB, partial [Bacteroidetes bacterium]|nr:flagellar motor protein MotB [Bacteroidota bacterium]